MPALDNAPYLKPCPFCGCELESKWNRPNPSAKCATTDCMGSKLPSLCLDVPDHIRAWNTRADAAYTRGIEDARAVFAAWVEPSDDLRKHPGECLGGVEGVRLLDSMANQIRVKAWPSTDKPLPMGTQVLTVTQGHEDFERLIKAYEETPVLPSNAA
jgi:hypothetical protein